MTNHDEELKAEGRQESKADLEKRAEPEPITEVEFKMAMMLVKGRFPNAAFVVEKYLEQRLAREGEK